MEHIKTFETLADFLTACDRPAHKSIETRKSRVTGGYIAKISACDTYDAARDLAAGGWEAGTRDISTRLAIVQPDSYSRQPIHDIAGERPDVGRYLAGAPDCMIRRGMARSTAKPCVDIVVNASFSASVNAEQIMNYGAAIVDAIDSLEAAGYSVALSVSCVMMTERTKRIQGALVRLKRHGEQMDIGRAAYCIAHPSFLRRLSFSLWETNCSKSELGNIYGSIADIPKDARGTIYFGKSASLPCDNMAQAQRYVRGIIDNQAPELIEAA